MRYIFLLKGFRKPEEDIRIARRQIGVKIGYLMNTK